MFDLLGIILMVKPHFNLFILVGAGNCLMVLTTLDGEWFLDDMCLMTEVSIKLASYILSPTLLENNPGIHLVTKCLDLLHGIYKRLQVKNIRINYLRMFIKMKF